MAGKLYRIGEAADLLELKDYVLRFWESEFPQLVPVRTAKGQRAYSEENLVLLRRIRHLLYDRRLTIEGARRVLEEEEKESPRVRAAVMAQMNFIRMLERELLCLRHSLVDGWPGRGRAASVPEEQPGPHEETT